MKFRLLITVLLICLLLLSCSPAHKPGGKDKLLIAVSVLPQKYFVQRIAGDLADVHVMIPPGESPATYSPTPREIMTLSRADIYFRIGHIPFEKSWMENLQDINKAMTVVDTSEGVRLIKEEKDDNGHQHGDDHYGHSHGGTDPHIWLSPSAVKIQASHITMRLIMADPDNRETFETNLHRFLEEINRLDLEIKQMLSEYRGKYFMVFHPAWSYFAREYELIQLPIEAEGKSTSPAEMKRVVDLAKKENIRVIFVQKQFDTNIAGAIATEIDGKVVSLDPLAENWPVNMKHIARTIAEAFTANR